jgi:signal transduction histidine kinase
MKKGAAMRMLIFHRSHARTAFGIALLVVSIAGTLSAWEVSRVQHVPSQLDAARALLDCPKDIGEAFRVSISASRGIPSDAVQLHRQSVESVASALRDLREGASVVLALLILIAVYYHLQRQVDRHERSASRLTRLNRLYVCLTQTNQTIVRVRTREELFRELCRVAVQDGHFAMAWIGTLEPESERIKPVAWWSRDEGHSPNAGTPPAGEPQGCGLDVSVVREASRFVCNDIAAESGISSWREMALACGYFSLAALPIKVEDSILGAFTLYADRPGFFDDESLRLLHEMTSDISFALRSIDQDQRRKLAENEIRRLDQDLERRVLERTAELGEANSRLAKQNEELIRASRMKSEFLARMSHEFRTPLNAIIGFADLLAEQGEGPLAAAYADYVRHVGEGAHHLLALANDILDLSRIEAGRIELRHEEFAASDAISEVLSVTRSLAEAKNIDVRSDAPPTLFVYGDRTRFTQILYNLLSNALKFTPAAGSVEVSAKPNYGEIRFCVTDTGIGIPGEQQAAIFEDFTQVAPPGSGEKEGAGLGLAITKRLVELHGGRIWVESIPGEGSRFSFIMPALRRYEAPVI